MELTQQATDLRINLDRLKKKILELAEIGKKDDGGIYRMAFTKEDFEGKDWLEREIKEAGLKAGRDGALNIIGSIPVNDKPAIIIGSHIDTVPSAGALDGSLGVLIGLECLNIIKESGIELKRSLELIAFSDEEGRFGGMFGSQAVAGMMTPGIIEESFDLDGNRLKDAISEHGYEPMHALEAARDPNKIKCYLELHIEQGPVLDNLQKSIGVVTDITGLFRWQITLSGNANHAGTTPMHMRNDAFMGLADFAHEIPRIIDENGTDDSRMTVGSVFLYPGAANTVPGKVKFSLDVRDTSEEILNELAISSRKALSAIARRQDLMFDFEELSWISPVHCDDELVNLLEKNSKALKYKYKKLPSGAAHDAQMMANVAPVAMVFVPSKGGISHSIHEWTDWLDIESGANLMLRTLIELAQK